MVIRQQDAARRHGAVGCQGTRNTHPGVECRKQQRGDPEPSRRITGNRGAGAGPCPNFRMRLAVGERGSSALFSALSSSSKPDIGPRVPSQGRKIGKTPRFGFSFPQPHGFDPNRRGSARGARLTPLRIPLVCPDFLSPRDVRGDGIPRRAEAHRGGETNPTFLRSPRAPRGPASRFRFPGR